MQSLRSSFAILLMAALATLAGYYGFNYVQKWQFVQAADRVDLTREQLAKVDDLAAVFRYVGRVVEPSVVNITVTKSAKLEGLKRFHRSLPFDNEGEMPDFDTPFEQHGTGSGVIMEAADGFGYILTNSHVAGDATELKITLHDGRIITNGKLLGTDKKSDLAVIKIQADRLIGSKWGNSDELQKGDWIMAFGSPLGYVGSMTHGIVSALNRNAGILGQNAYENFIQVDAPINPGNSGGPLVNVRGEVVGINTAIASRTGTFSGIGFAIPSNQAKFVYESLKGKGKVVRGWVGVSISDVSRDLPKAKSFGYDGTTGALVEQVMPGTPASGKLQNGDIVTAINGTRVESVQQFRSAVAALAPNTDARMNVFRDGKSQEIVIKLGEQPEDLASARRSPRTNDNGAAEKNLTVNKLGIRAADPSRDLLGKWKLDDIKTGAVVTAVDRNSLAAKAGIIPGDIITTVGKTQVANAAELDVALAKADLAAGVRLYVTTRDPETNQTISRYVFVRETAPQE